MKIFNVINNYDGPASAPTPFPAGDPGTPLWFGVPDSSLMRTGNPFFVPDFDTDFQAFPSIAFRIGRLGKSIASRFASRYLEAVGMGVAVAAVNRLRSLRGQGMPWTPAVAFDRSCIIGNLQPVATLLEMDEILIECGEEAIMYRPASLRESIERIIERISADNTLKNGDLILAGLTPAGLPLRPGTRLTAGNGNLLDTNIR